MGAFFGNIGVKATDKNSIEQVIQESGEKAYIAGSVNGWFLIFPANDFELPNIGQGLSQKANTLAVVGQVFDSDDFAFQVYENGKLVFDYLEDRTSGKGIAINAGSVKDLEEYFEALNVSVLEEILNKEDYVFSEEKYQDVLKILDMPSALGNLWGFEYIERADDDGRHEEKEKDLPNLVKIP